MQGTIRDEAHGSIQDLIVGEVYSNDDIFRALKVSNAGGIRLSLLDKSVRRAVIMTSVQDSLLSGRWVLDSRQSSESG